MDVNALTKFLSSLGSDFVFLIEVYVKTGSEVETYKPLIRRVSINDLNNLLSEFSSIINCHIFVTNDESFVKNLLSDKELFHEGLICMDCNKYKIKHKIPVICCYDEHIEY